MAAIVTYSTGTATVAAGGTTVTGIGTIWSGVNARPGDILQIGNFQTIISDVTDITHLVIPPWGGGAQTSQPYTIHQVSPQRFAGAQAMADVSTLVAALNTSGFFFFVGLTETVPDPSLGSDGQFAYQPTTGKTWSKTGGVWVLQTSTAGVSVGIRQAYSSTTTDADPGAGAFRLNHATPASATAAFLDNLDAGGATVSGIWDLFDDSTSATRGFIRFQKANDPTKWAQYRVTGAVVDGTGYRKLTLAGGVASVSSFTAGDVFAITFYRTGDASSGDMLAANNLSDVANKATARTNLGVPLKGHLFGATLSAAGSTGTFGIAAGEAADSTGVDLMVLASAYTKTTSAWAVGSGNGAMDTGTVANSTWYHVHLIKRPDSSVVDVLFSLSATSPTLPANYTLFRRIGSMKTNGSAQWVKFSQTGDQFLWDATVTDLSTATQGTSAASVTLSTPLGVKTTALLRCFMTHAAVGNVILLSSLDESDQAASGSNFNVGATQVANGLAATSVQVLTNTSSQIRARGNASSTTLWVATYGWIDTRGRLS